MSAKIMSSLIVCEKKHNGSPCCSKRIQAGPAEASIIDNLLSGSIWGWTGVHGSTGETLITRNGRF